jgi:hypothetical protein
MAEVGEGAIGNRLPEIENTKETEPGIVHNAEANLRSDLTSSR